MALKKTADQGICGFGILAEGVGFEPTIRYNRIPDFESGAFDHSATLPCRSLSYCEGRILTKDLCFCTRLSKIFRINRSDDDSGTTCPTS